MSTPRIEQHTLTTRLAQLGNELAAAVTPSQKHAAAVALLKVRLVYFTGREVPTRDAQVDELCRDLDPSDVQALTDWCWSAYSGGMEVMKESFDNRRRADR